ncbi:MAG: FHA domain-containing protein [Dermatophilaceae bacterium]
MGTPRDDGRAHRAATPENADGDGLEVAADDRSWVLWPGATFAVGRDPSCEIRLDHVEVSRRHARISFDPSAGWTLTDTGSMNGVYVDGVRVPLVRLHPSVVVAFGPATRAPTMSVLGSGAQKPTSPGPAPPIPRPSAPQRASQVAATPTAPLPHPLGADPLIGRAASIGRGADNEIVVDDLLVSRHHARVTPANGGFWVEDLSSLNGTYVNGSPITSTLLRPGDRLTLGHAEFGIDGDGRLRMTPARARVSFVADELHVVLPQGKKILAGVSFELPEASLLAVIGPSGAGKSTLLGALTGARRATTGQVLFDGRDLYDNYHELRHRIGVVPQDDVVHRQLTVRQALGYASELRFPADLERRERESRIEQVVSELGLRDHLDTRIDRLSGGQRKRTSVAMELLTRPSLLFLDEPTSGLDPGLDRSVMQTLRGLANDGRTVIVVTHSVANLGLCDQVLLLAPGGSVAYVGPPDEVLPYFGSRDYSDVFEAVTADPAGVTARFAALAARVPRGADRHHDPGPSAEPLRQQTRWRQTMILVRRHLRVLVADRSYAAFIATLPIVMAALVMTVPGEAGFGPAQTPPTSEPTQLLVVLLVGAAFMGLAASARDLVGERPIFVRERAVGLAPGAYLSAKVVVFGGLALLQSLVMVGLVMLVKPRPDTASALGHGTLEILVAVSLTTFACATLGLLISAVVSTPEQVMPLLIVTLMSQLVLCGGLIPVADRAGLEHVAYISPSRWGYAAAASTVDVLAKLPMTPHADGASAASSTGDGTPAAVPGPATAKAPVSTTADSSAPAAAPTTVRTTDPLWEHESATWWLSVAMLVALSAAFTSGTRWRLGRTGRVT